MKVLVIGQGGREHAIVWKLKQSQMLTEIYAAPGNAGIAELAKCVPIKESNFRELVNFVKQEKIDLTIVGPENPLMEGIVNYFSEHNLKIIGPTKEAAQIEGSKAFAKELMKKYQIPTADYQTFTDLEEALIYLKKQKIPIVIKADGLAAGKGVIVAKSYEEAETALKSMLEAKRFGQAGTKVVIEEYLEGEELTILSFVDGNVVKPMVEAQDHKPAYDNDLGPNTGGMGAYSPVPQIPRDIIAEAFSTIIEPITKALVMEGIPFRGILYTGLMITKAGPKVIEFNARFGDPETQVVLPRLKTDLLKVFKYMSEGKLQDIDLAWSEDAAVCVVLASEGYPGTYETGKEIIGLDKIKMAGNMVVFHAATLKKDSKFLTNGGRVLGVVGLGDNLITAQKNAYHAINELSFADMHYRKDIADKGRFHSLHL